MSGSGHVAASAPEGLVALVGVIVEDQEVAHALPFEIALAVEFVAIGLFDIAAGNQLQEARNGRLDHVDAGGFERLHETRRKSHGDDVMRPHPLPLFPVVKRISRGSPAAFALDIGEQKRSGVVVAQICAGIDEAVAGAMLQRNAPLPARSMRGRTRVGGEVCSARRGQALAPGRKVASASSPRYPTPRVSPISRPRKPVQSMKKSPSIAGPAIKSERRDVAALAIAMDRHDLPFDPRVHRALRHSGADRRRRDRHRGGRHRACRAGSSRYVASRAACDPRAPRYC